MEKQQMIIGQRQFTVFRDSQQVYFNLIMLSLLLNIAINNLRPHFKIIDFEGMELVTADETGRYLTYQVREGNQAAIALVKHLSIDSLKNQAQSVFA